MGKKIKHSNSKLQTLETTTISITWINTSGDEKCCTSKQSPDLKHKYLVMLL